MQDKDETHKKRTVGVLLFEGFETLDAMGPIELFGMHPDSFEVHCVAETRGAIASTHGHQTVAARSIGDDEFFDIVLVPGGIGTRTQVDNPVLIAWIKQMADQTEILASVCTGAALLAQAGVLDGKKATSNKMNFSFVAELRPQVDWVGRARWVEEGDIFTSSGVSAGMDMTLAIISRLLGSKAAEDAALWAEYTWHRDANDDPFAASWGLT
ncbi:MAG: DJ-1/PfpI family protein [Pseudomonadota bacterium]